MCKIRGKTRSKTTMSAPAHISELMKKHYHTVARMRKNDKMVEFDKAVSDLSDEERTMFAQLCIWNFCSYDPDVDLAKFYLEKMIDIGRPPVDCRYEHPLLQELAHQCEYSRTSEVELLFLLFEHPCYKRWLHSDEYTDKYRCTFLDRYLVGKYYHLEKEDTPLRSKLKELFPKEYPVLMAKAIHAGNSLDPIVTYTGRGFPMYF